MTGSYDGLRLAARAAKPDPEDKPEEIEPDDDEDDSSPDRAQKKESNMTDTELQTKLAEAEAKGFKAANDRMNAVFASKHYAGREALAHSLLGKSMSAEDIVDVLGNAPKAEAPAPADPAAVREAAEAGGRKEMQEALAQNRNSAIEPGAQDAPGSGDAKAAAAVWDNAIANEFPQARK